jgi:hypothetical protein
MKTILTTATLFLILTSCNETKEYQKGAPIIVQKQKSVTGSCLYTYEGYGREEWFEDECDKYSVGDTLK